MSQITTFGSGGGGGGTVITITGNTGGPVGPDGFGNINIVGTGNITVGGNPGINTEFISITGVIPIVHGGTNASTFSVTDGTVYFDGTRLVTTATGTSGFVLTSNGPGMAPTYQAASAGGITTINGDTGSVTGATVDFNGQPQAGGSVTFSGSGTTMLLNMTDSFNNTFVGINSGNTTVSFTNNSAYGTGSLSAVSTGQNNTAMGASSMASLVSGDFNCGLGQTFQSMVSGDHNIGLGYGAGLSMDGGSDNFIVGTFPLYYAGNYTSTESANICINNQGVTGDNHVIRIGTTGSGTAQQNSCYIAGIDGVDLSTATLVTESSDQLGTTVLTAGTNITITPGAGTLTIDASGGGSTVMFHAFLDTSVTNVTGDGTVYTIPYNATLINTGSGFNTGTGEFTAPNTGFYSFCVNMYLQNILPADTIGYAYIDVNAGALQYFFIDANFASMTDINGNFAINASNYLPLTAGDVVTIQFAVVGVMKTVGMAGAATSAATSFSGFQVA